MLFLDLILLAPPVALAKGGSIFSLKSSLFGKNKQKPLVIKGFLNNRVNCLRQWEYIEKHAKVVQNRA